MAIADRGSYLRDVADRLRRQWPDNRAALIACHGHSVPAGYFCTPRVDTFNAYPHLLHRGLAERHPFAVINVVVTAIGGEHSEAGASRFGDDVLRLRPDLVTIDYGLNDRSIGLERARRAWEAMIQAAQTAGCPVLLLTPTLDASAADPVTDAGMELDSHAAQVRALADRHGVGLVDSTAVWRRQAGINRLLSQSNHPSRAGHALVADELLDWFPPC